MTQLTHDTESWPTPAGAGVKHRRPESEYRDTVHGIGELTETANAMSTMQLISFRTVLSCILKNFLLNVFKYLLSTAHNPMFQDKIDTFTILINNWLFRQTFRKKQKLWKSLFIHSRILLLVWTVIYYTAHVFIFYKFWLNYRFYIFRHI